MEPTKQRRNIGSKTLTNSLAAAALLILSKFASLLWQITIVFLTDNRKPNVAFISKILENFRVGMSVFPKIFTFDKARKITDQIRA